MKAKQLVSKYLKSVGIATRKNELGLIFPYGGWNFLLWDDADDPLFFRLILPGILDVTDDIFAEALMACNKVSWDFKVVKAVLCEYEDEREKGSSVWICYEQLLDAKSPIEEVMSNALRSLIAAAEAFNREMAEDEVPYSEMDWVIPFLEGDF